MNRQDPINSLKLNYELPFDKKINPEPAIHLNILIMDHKQGLALYKKTIFP